MDRKGFKNRMKQYKKAREENPGLKYWEWKSIPKYDEGTGRVIDTINPNKIVDYNSSLDTNLAKRIKYLESLTSDLEFKKRLVNSEKDWAESSVTGDHGPYVIDGGQLPELTVRPTPIYATLRTEYPFINENTPWTGHSALIPDEGQIVSVGGQDKNYNLFCNNCSNATKRVLERTFGKEYPTTLFTTPGDVLDFAVDSLGAKEVPTLKRGVREHRIKLTPLQSKKLRYEAYKENRIFNNEPVLSEKDFYKKVYGYAEGGEVEPDPLEVLERSRPKVAGIPINDRPLSGTDPLGELYLNLVSGNAVRKAVANGVNGMVRKSFYNNYKELLKAGWNRQRAYDYASPELAIDVLPGIAKGFDYTLKGANYTHAIEDFVK